MSARLRCTALLGLCLAAAACSQRLDFERMRQQPRANPYGASGAFADGMAMRTPPAGTVTAAIAERATEAPDGRRQFQVHCAVCHGTDASGRSVMARNMPGVPPPSLVSAVTAGRSDRELLDVIAHGRNRMPGYDWAMTETGRAAVVAYLRSLQQAAHATSAPTEEKAR